MRAAGAAGLCDVGHQQVHQADNVALLDDQPPVHVKFTELEVRIEAEGKERAAVLEGDGYAWLALAVSSCFSTGVSNSQAPPVDIFAEQEIEHVAPGCA